MLTSKSALFDSPYIDILEMEAMQIQSECLMELYIGNYHNRASKQLVNSKKQKLFLYKGYFCVAYEEPPQQIQDKISYDRIIKVNNLKANTKQKQMDVVAISLKGDSKPNISFRVSQERVAVGLVDLLIKKVKEFNNLPDFTDLLQHKEQIIEKIKDSQPEYRDIFNVLSKRIPTLKLTGILFENHKLMREYMSAAVSKGFQLDREYLLTELKEKPKKKPGIAQISEVLEGYDAGKKLQGRRFQDDQKKIKFTPTVNDIDDDLFFSSLPQANVKPITESFVEIAEEPMQIEHSEMLRMQEESDVTIVRPVILPRPQKGKYRIDQPKEILIAGTGKGDKRKDQRERMEKEPNVELAKRVTLILKLYYRVIGIAGTSSEEVSAIENQLHRILNGEPKPGIFLEIPINKAIQSILKWKRENSAYNK